MSLAVRRLFLTLPFIALFAAVVSACGARADLSDPNAIVVPDGGLPDGVTPPPNTCGNGVCDNGETCDNCPIDCGFCSTCGNGVCDPGETCLGCPQDCGKCPNCGDGTCTMPLENCVNCPEDCGVCASCGDGICQTDESCENCPQDCGVCSNCPGDNLCDGTKTCISCPEVCGVCDVCGNGVCQMPFETCTNCPADCGSCTTVKNCFEAFTCAIACIDLMGNPPSFSLSCVSNCIAEACANGQFFANQAVDCIIDAAVFGDAGCKDIMCLESACNTQITACIASSCD